MIFTITAFYISHIYLLIFLVDTDCALCGEGTEF